MRDGNCTCPFEDPLTWPVPLNRHRLRRLGNQLPEGAKITPGRRWMRSPLRSHGRCYCDTLRCLLLSLRADAMKRPSRAGGQPVKARRRKAVTLKHRNAPKVTYSRPSSVGGKDKKIALLTRERDEALEQLTATSEVLQFISSFPDNLLPVFEAILEKAVHICDAKFGYIYRWDGDAFDLVATYNVPPALASARRGLRFIPNRACRLDACWRQKRRFTSRMLRLSRSTLKNAIQQSSWPWKSVVYARYWLFQC